MKKFEVQYAVDENHTIIYEIEAESEQQVEEMLDDGSFLDYATQKVDRLDWYEDRVEEIREVSTPTSPTTPTDALSEIRGKLSECYDSLYELASQKDDYSDAMAKLSDAIDIIFNIEKKGK